MEKAGFISITFLDGPAHSAALAVLQPDHLLEMPEGKYLTTLDLTLPRLPTLRPCRCFPLD